MKKVIAVLILLALTVSLFAAAQTEKKDKELATVRICCHTNEGATLTATAYEQGIFEKHGINAVLTLVDSGPPEIAALRADNRDLDIGYIGPGVSWNAIDETGNQLSWVFFDYLGNSEQLLAKKGVFTDADNDGSYSIDEVYEGLKGQVVYMEVGTTPGSWFWNLLKTLNEGRADADKLWVECEVAAYLAGYTAPNSNPANKVTVVNYANANIAAGMATSDSTSVKVTVCFSPVTTTILKTNSAVEKIADASMLPAAYVSPGIWIASDKWLEENPEVAQNFIDALYEAACYRTLHVAESIAAAEALCNKAAGSFSQEAIRSISMEEYQTWFADKNSVGYQYLRALYDSKVGNIPAGTNPKPFEKAFNDSYMLKSIANITSL